MSHRGPEIPHGAPSSPPARHDLLLVDPADWASVVATLRDATALTPEGRALVQGWGEAGRPVIARRPAPGDRPGAVPVGLPLPPCARKARVALSVPALVRWQRVPPVLLADAAAAAPAPWRAAVSDLLVLAEAVSAAPRVFGALLWEVVTGLPYLRSGSDLDLLWPVEDPHALAALLDGLGGIAARAPMQIDGEVLTVSGGVQWRELAEARRDPDGIVLARSMDRARFVSVGSILPRRMTPCR